MTACSTAGRALATPLSLSWRSLTLHKLYAYVTLAHPDWLGSLIDADARWRDVPFSKLVLAAAHDCGMCTWSSSG